MFCEDAKDFQTTTGSTQVAANGGGSPSTPIEVMDLEDTLPTSKEFVAPHMINNIIYQERLEAYDIVRSTTTCELCGFKPKTKNKYRERQDHLYMKHFKEEFDRMFTFRSPWNCPAGMCTYSGKDKQSVLRHFIGKHGILEKYLSNTLAMLTQPSQEAALAPTTKHDNLSKYMSEALAEGISVASENVSALEHSEEESSHSATSKETMEDEVAVISSVKSSGEGDSKYMKKAPFENTSSSHETVLLLKLAEEEPQRAEQSVHGDNLFKCDICNRSFNYSHDLLNHKSTHRKRKHFRCKACLKIFKSDVNLIMHSCLDDFTCELCGCVCLPKTKNKYREKEEHLYTKHFKEEFDRMLPTNSPWLCPADRCTFSGKDKQSLVRHSFGRHSTLEKCLNKALFEKTHLSHKTALVDHSDTRHLAISKETIENEVLDLTED